MWGDPYRERIMQAGPGDNVDLGSEWEGPAPRAPTAAPSGKEHKLSEPRLKGQGVGVVNHRSHPSPCYLHTHLSSLQQMASSMTFEGKGAWRILI